MCGPGQQDFFIMVDYWSGFLQVQELKITTARVITAFKHQFAWNFMSEVLITENGTQSSSSDFEFRVRPLRSVDKGRRPSIPQVQ